MVLSKDQIRQVKIGIFRNTIPKKSTVLLKRIRNIIEMFEIIEWWAKIDKTQQNSKYKLIGDWLFWLGWVLWHINYCT